MNEPVSAELPPITSSPPSVRRDDGGAGSPPSVRPGDGVTGSPPSVRPGDGVTGSPPSVRSGDGVTGSPPSVRPEPVEGERTGAATVRPGSAPASADSARPRKLGLADALELETAGDRTRAIAVLAGLAGVENPDPDAIFHLGRLLMAAGERDAARGRLEEASRLRADHPATWRELAVFYMDAGELASAELSLRQLRKLRPSNAWALRQLGRVLLEMGRHRQAVETLDGYLMEHFEDRGAHIDLCRAYMGAGRFDRARDELKVLGEKTALEPEALMLIGEMELAEGNVGGAVANLQAALNGGYAGAHVRLLLARAMLAAQDPAGALRALHGLTGCGPEAILEAHARHRLGDLAGALRRIEHALSEDPTNVEAMGLMADLLEASGRQRDALTCCLRLRELGATPDGLALRLARLQMAGGDPEAARVTLNGHLSEHPDDVEALLSAADLELDRGHDNVAFKMYNRVVERDPCSARAYVRLARIWLSHDRPRRSLASARKAFELRPAEAEAALAVAEALQALEETDEARRHYEIALELGSPAAVPDHRLAAIYAELGQQDRVKFHGLRAVEGGMKDARLCRHLSNTFKLEGDLREARRWLDEGMELEPGDASLLECLAELDLLEGNVDAAITRARAALGEDGDRPLGRRVLGLAFARNGQTVAAMPLLSRTLSEHPDDEEARLELARAHFHHGADQEVLALFPDATTLPAQRETLGLMLARSAQRAGEAGMAREILENLQGQGCESLELLELLGEALAAMGESSRAERVLSDTTRRHPQAWGPWLRLAELHATLGRLFEARQELGHARKLAPSEPVLYLASGRLELSDKRPADAAAHLDSYIRMEPRDPRGFHLRGEAYLMAGRPGHAEDCFRRALFQDAGHLEACIALGRLLLRQGRAAEARRMLDRFAASSSRRREILGELAAVYLSEDRPREAEAYLRELLASGPEGVDAARPLAELLLAQKRDREALEAISEAGERAGGLMIEMGAWLSARGEHRRARVVYEKALHMAASRESALLGMARCLRASGERAQARERLEELIEHAPDHMEGHLELARLLAEDLQAEPQDVEKAFGLVDRFRDRLAGDPRALNLMASVALRLGRRKDASEAIRQSLELDVRQAEAYAILGHLHRESGEHEPALEAYLKALALDPGMEDAACHAIAFLEAGGHLEQARTIMEKVVGQQPESRVGRLALARICSRLGDWKTAALHWEAAIRGGKLGADDLTGLATTYVKMQRYADAERVNAMRLAADPKGLDPVLLAGDIAQAAGRLAEARVRFTQAARQHPESAEAPARLAHLFYDDGRLQDALFHVRRALELKPGDAAYHLVHGRILAELNRFENARESLEKAAAVSGPQQAEARLLLARVFRHLDDRRRATDTLQGILEDEGASAEAMRELAELYFEKGDWPRSTEAFERLRSTREGLDPASKEKLARCYARMGMSAKGTGVLRELTAKGRAPVEVVLELARAHLRQGSTREALALMLEHLPSQPLGGKARLHGEIGRVYQKAGDEKAAEKNLVAALSLKPEDPQVQAQIASFFEETHRFDAMRSTFQHLTRRYPSSARAHCYLGGACLKLGADREASQAFERAIKLDYNLPEAHAGLARAHRNEGELSAAIEEYRKARFLLPRHGRLAFELATAYVEAGQAAQAGAQFEKVLELEAANSNLASAAREQLRNLRRPR